MAFGASFQLTGDRQLDALFREFSRKVQRKVLRKPLRDAAKVILAQVKADMPKRTGEGAKSLKVRAGKRSRRTANEVRIQVATEAGFFRGNQFYLGFVEFGFQLGSRKRYPQGHQLGRRFIPQRIPVPGKHYIERAFEKQRAQALTVALTGIRGGIIREAASASA